MFFVYFLRTRDGYLYIGTTKCLDRRLYLHRMRRGAKFTKDHPGAELVYLEKYPSLVLARRREIQVKKWSRTKKEALIANGYKVQKIVEP